MKWQGTLIRFDNFTILFYKNIHFLYRNGSIMCFDTGSLINCLWLGQKEMNLMQMIADQQEDP